jgi:hypothetical protein
LGHESRHLGPGQRARLTVPPMFGQCFRSRSNDSNRPKATA